MVSNMYKSDEYEISVVIPCLNEERTIGICIAKVVKAFEKNKINGEIIVSDNGSTDKSVDIAMMSAKDNNGESIIKIVYCGEKGYGNALLYGISHARGKYIIMGDADNTYDFLQIPGLYYKAVSDMNIDMVMGSRFKGIIQNNAMPSLHKYIGNPMLTYIINILFNGKISDSQCGLRLFKKSAFDKIVFQSAGMEFATEIIIEFLHHNFKIVEIPVNLYNGPPGRKPHLDTFKDGFRILYFIFRKKLNYIFFKQNASKTDE